MKKIWLFTDGSVNPQQRIGMGAFLAVSDSELPMDLLANQIKVKRFDDTSSTKLELQIPS